MSGDLSKSSGGSAGRGRQAKTAPGAAKSAEKERLAAALRENLKRRKAQLSARRGDPGAAD